VKLAAAASGLGRLPAADVLDREEELTAGERERIRGVPDAEAGVVARSKLLKDLGVPGILAALLENWDGSGVPKGLKAEAVPAGARVLRLAWSYNGMVSERPRRKAMSPEEALARIAKLKGSRFDPRLADLFAEVVRGSVPPSANP
jgi:response regulator RpfG family c-di-GMP phosphodiesterase